jgi:SAM-dependent methyltransferase
MEPAEYDRMFAAEDRHFWFRGKREWIGAVLDRHLGPVISGPILDAGCGTGANLLYLSGRGESFGVEKDSTAVERCRQRGLSGRIVRGSVNQLAFRDGAFSLVGLFDVLYHREVGPECALAEAHRVLRSNGNLLITDSAVPLLTGPHDAAVWGRTRFTRRSLRLLVEAAGFEVLRLSYANCLLFPLILALRLVERTTGRERAGVSPRLLPGNRVLYAILRFEAALLRAGVNLPWGSSILCLARRR